MDAVNAAAGITSAALTGAMGIASSRLNYRESKKLARDQYYYNMDMANRQNAFNLEMWNMQNQYNSPAAQMQRLKDAGLNPNMIYNNGSASTGNSSSPPEMVAAGRQVPDFKGFGFEKLAVLGSLWSNILDLEQKQAGIDNSLQTNRNIQLQNDLLAKDAELKQQDLIIKQLFATNYGIKNSRDMFEYQSGRSLFQYNLEALKLANERQLYMLTEGLPAQTSLWRSQAGYNKIRRKQAMYDYVNLSPWRAKLARYQAGSAFEDWQLRKAGVNPNDNTLMRIFGGALGNVISPSLRMLSSEIGDALSTRVRQFLYPDYEHRKSNYFDRFNDSSNYLPDVSGQTF
jgi:hypothetical protein